MPNKWGGGAKYSKVQKFPKIHNSNSFWGVEIILNDACMYKKNSIFEISDPKNNKHGGGYKK